MDEWWNKFRLTVNQLFSYRRSRIQRYGVSLILILVVLSVKTILNLFWGDVISFHLLTIVVIFSAWYGGFGPGIFTALVSGIASLLLFLPSTDSLTQEENVYSTGLFLIEGFLISIISEARKQAEQQKDEFIGLASHELKNPLAVAKGYAGLAKQKAAKSKDYKLVDYASSIERYISKTTELVNDLLDLTRIESGKFAYHDEVFSVYDLVEEIVHDQSLTTKTHKIHLNGRSTKTMVGDRYRIGQILINLITNAIKYSPNAKNVDVNIKNNQEGSLVSVKDYGLGISKKDQERIFNRFYRVNNYGKIQGLGVGLYISSQIVRRHNAKLWVKSRVGKGSTFFLQLPSQKAEP